MPREHVNPKTLFPSLPYGFPQIVVASGRKTAFISGQTAWDAEKRIVGGGGTLKDIVALRIYIVNHQAESVKAVGSALREFFSQENPPASTWIGVSALAVPDFLIEIEATAVLD